MANRTLTAETIASAKRAANGAVAIPFRGARKVLIFHVGGQAYGIGLDAIQEILPLSLLSQPPGLPPMLAGLLNLAGVAVPVVKLARLFGLAELEPRLYTPLLVVRSGDLPLALLVDSVQGIGLVDEPAITPFRENDCAIGLAAVGEANVVVLCVQRLLREQEQRRLSELAAIEQTRLAAFEEAPR